jgi:hypothetical protein
MKSFDRIKFIVVFALSPKVRVQYYRWVTFWPKLELTRERFFKCYPPMCLFLSVMKSFDQSKFSVVFALQNDKF